MQIWTWPDLVVQIESEDFPDTVEDITLEAVTLTQGEAYSVDLSGVVTADHLTRVRGGVYSLSVSLDGMDAPEEGEPMTLTIDYLDDREVPYTATATNIYVRYSHVSRVSNVTAILPSVILPIADVNLGDYTLSLPVFYSADQSVSMAADYAGSSYRTYPAGNGCLLVISLTEEAAEHMAEVFDLSEPVTLRIRYYEDGDLHIIDIEMRVYADYGTAGAGMFALMEYYPEFLKQVLEFHYINTAAMEPYVNELEREERRFIDRHYIFRADETGLAYMEKIYGLTPKDSDTLEDRRVRLWLYLADPRPFTYRRMRQWMDSICGKDGYTAELFPDEYRLKVRVALTSRSQYATVEAFLRRMIPANIVLDISLAFNTYNTYTNKYYHNEMDDYTWTELKEKEGMER